MQPKILLIHKGPAGKSINKWNIAMAYGCTSITDNGKQYRIPGIPRGNLWIAERDPSDSFNISRWQRVTLEQAREKCGKHWIGQDTPAIRCPSCGDTPPTGMAEDELTECWNCGERFSLSALAYPILRHFAHAHLPPHLARISAPLCELATNTAAMHPYPSPEVAAGLRKLLEAKDCFVRAAIENRTE